MLDDTKDARFVTCCFLQQQKQRSMSFQYLSEYRTISQEQIALQAISTTQKYKYALAETDK